VAVSTGSSVNLFFAVLLLTVPPCPAICKSGNTCLRALWSRRHCKEPVPSSPLASFFTDSSMCPSTHNSKYYHKNARWLNCRNWATEMAVSTVFRAETLDDLEEMVRDTFQHVRGK